MLATAVRSLAPLDHVLVYEGPVEQNPGAGPESEVGVFNPKRLTYKAGEWASDAVKRTAMLEHAQQLPRQQGEALWGLWLDGDELLLWGEYLRDWVWRVSQQGDDGNEVAGWPFALVELDGSVSLCMGKLVRLDLVRRYLISSSYIELVNGDRRTVGNVEYWNPVDGPTQFDGEGRPHWRARPPLQGEPHLQHRPVLRSRLRAAERQHLAEARNFEGVDLTA